MSADIVKKAVALARTLGPFSTPEHWKELEELKHEMSYPEFKDYLVGIQTELEAKKK